MLDPIVILSLSKDLLLTAMWKLIYHFHNIA